MDAQPDKLKATLGILSEGRALSGAEATKAFEIILNGEATPSQIGAFCPLCACAARRWTKSPPVSASCAPMR